MATASASLVVRSRRIYTSAGWFDGSVVVKGERIVGLVSSDEEPQGGERIDVNDQPVIPGLVDTHVHFRDPGFTDKEDFETGSRAAAAGGVTTVLDMPNVRPVTNTVEALEAHIANAARKSLVDFGHNASGTIPENIAELAAAGATNFKIFMITDVGRSYPHMPGAAVGDHATLLRACEEIARTGLTLFVHPFDQEIYHLQVQQAQERWGMDFRSYARAQNQNDGVVATSGVATLIQLQRATGVKLHILHMSNIESFEMVRRAKALGRTITTEVNPHTLFVSHPWENVERLGPYALGRWVPDRHADATLREVRDGGICDVLATDHAPHTKDEKESGWADMYACPGGTPSIQEYLSLLLTEVNKGTFSLERVIKLCSTNPAKISGLYPRKGVIAPGADADLVVLDLQRHGVVTAKEKYYSKCGWTPNEGREVTAMPVMTILRGRVIMKEGDVFAEPGLGKFQQRVESAEQASLL